MPLFYDLFPPHARGRRGVPSSACSMTSSRRSRRERASSERRRRYRSRLPRLDHRRGRRSTGSSPGALQEPSALVADDRRLPGAWPIPCRSVFLVHAHGHRGGQPAPRQGRKPRPVDRRGDGGHRGRGAVRVQGPRSRSRAGWRPSARSSRSGCRSTRSAASTSSSRLSLRGDRPPPPARQLARLSLLPPDHRRRPGAPLSALCTPQEPPADSTGQRVSEALERILYGYAKIVVISNYLLSAKLFPALKQAASSSLERRVSVSRLPRLRPQPLLPVLRLLGHRHRLRPATRHGG